MFRSMTAYGQSQVFIGEISFLVEISSVNRKNLDININVPKEFLCFEIPFRKRLFKELRRGFVSLRLSKEKEIVKTKSLRDLEIGALRKKLHALKEMASQLGFNPEKEISFPFLLDCNFIVDEVSEVLLSERGKQALMEGFEKALSQFISMREKEAMLLLQDFYLLLDKIETSLLQVTQQKAAVVLKLQNKLKSKLEEIGALSDSDNDRILKEVVLFADKVDFQEEVTRMFAHVHQFRELLSSDQLKSGKDADFLIQELNRELNTIGAKAQDLQITKNVLSMKSDIEKIREQIQNIE